MHFSTTLRVTWECLFHTKLLSKMPMALVITLQSTIGCKNNTVYDRQKLNVGLQKPRIHRI